MRGSTVMSHEGVTLGDTHPRGEARRDGREAGRGNILLGGGHRLLDTRSHLHLTAGKCTLTNHLALERHCFRSRNERKKSQV